MTGPVLGSRVIFSSFLSVSLHHYCSKSGFCQRFLKNAIPSLWYLGGYPALGINVLLPYLVAFLLPAPAWCFCCCLLVFRVVLMLCLDVTHIQELSLLREAARLMVSVMPEKPFTQYQCTHCLGPALHMFRAPDVWKNWYIWRKLYIFY